MNVIQGSFIIFVLKGRDLQYSINSGIGADNFWSPEPENQWNNIEEIK